MSVQVISSDRLPWFCAGSPGRLLSRKRTTHVPTRPATTAPMMPQTISVWLNSVEMASASGECGSNVEPRGPAFIEW
jgi:hypothetical protein